MSEKGSYFCGGGLASWLGVASGFRTPSLNAGPPPKGSAGCRWGAGAPNPPGAAPNPPGAAPNPAGATPPMPPKLAAKGAAAGAGAAMPPNGLGADCIMGDAKALTWGCGWGGATKVSLNSLKRSTEGALLAGGGALLTTAAAVGCQKDNHKIKQSFVKAVQFECLIILMYTSQKLKDIL